MSNFDMNSRKEEVLAEFQKDHSLTRTATHFGLTDGKLYYWLDKWGALPPRRKISWSVLDEAFVRGELEKMMPLIEVAKLLSVRKEQSVTRSMLVNFMTRRGIPIPDLQKKPCRECGNEFIGSAHTLLCDRCAPYRKKAS